MRIASLAPSNTEILYAIGAGNDIVATTSLCDYPPEALEKQSLGGWSKGSDIEALREINPDLVFTSDDLQESIRDEIDFADVVHVAPKTMDEVYQSFIRIGEATDNVPEAKKVVDKMKSSIREINIEDSPKVYCEEWSEPPMISGNWIPGLLEGAGFKYMIDEGERSRKFETKEIVDFDPEHIFMNICGASESLSPQKILERDSWKDITAVRDRNVHIIDDSLLNRPGPRLVEGLKSVVRNVNERH